MTDASIIESHYTQGDLLGRITTALVESGCDPDALKPDDLEPVDAFHIRRGEATRELARVADLKPGLRVLDVGSGLGGTCRYLATAHGCQATGIDLTQEYCDVATALSQRVGLSDRTVFRQASALDLPFDDNTFDFVWTEHVQMNVQDKTTFYGEIARVLAPGGRFAFHDILSGPGGEPHYPVPWAGDASISFLIGPEDLRELLASIGFDVRHWTDVTELSRRWFEATSVRTRQAGAPPLGIHLLMGASAPQKLANMVRNLQEGRVSVVQAVATGSSG